MLISIHGNDRGYAVVLALVLIAVFSSMFITFVSRVEAVRKYSAENKAKVIDSIEQSNREIASRHELY